MRAWPVSGMALKGMEEKKEAEGTHVSSASMIVGEGARNLQCGAVQLQNDFCGASNHICFCLSALLASPPTHAAPGDGRQRS